MRSEHADKYAAKWRADGNTGEPTDEALREAFAGCVRPAKPDEYDDIREAIAREGATFELSDDARDRARSGDWSSAVDEWFTHRTGGAS